MKKKKTRKRSKKRGSSSLNGIPGSSGGAVTLKEGIGHGALAAVVGIGAAGIGAGIGVVSIPIGLASLIYGIKRHDKYSKFLIAAGVGMLAGTAIRKSVQVGEETEGFSVKSMMNRSKSYFESLKDKVLMIPFVNNEESTSQTTAEITDAGTATNGLNGEEVKYFVNPYTRKSTPALNQLDRILEQVEQTKQMEGVAEIDPAMRNF